MKILYKAIIYMGIMVCVVLFLNYVVPNQYEKQRIQISEILNNPSSYESLTFGRSHAGALVYDFYNKKGQNLAMGGRDMASIDYLVEYLVPRCNSLKEILLFISYTSLYYDNNALSAGNLNDARKALYYTVPSFFPINYNDFNNFVFGKAFNFIKADHGWSLLKDWIYKNNEVSCGSKGLNTNAKESEMISSGIKQANRDLLDKRNSLNYNKNIYNDNIRHIEHIIALCKENGITLFFVSAPYYHTYIERVSSDIIEETKLTIYNLSNKYGIVYYDLSEDVRFKNDISLFSNSDHLNKKGKEKFTEIFNELTK